MNAKNPILGISLFTIALFAGLGVTRAQTAAETDAVRAISNLENDGVKADLAGDPEFYQKGHHVPHIPAGVLNGSSLRKGRQSGQVAFAHLFSLFEIIDSVGYYASLCLCSSITAFGCELSRSVGQSKRLLRL